MVIIPVLDILNGHVVHARGGKRVDYQLVQSLLCQDPDPNTVVQSYLSIYPFKTIYLADLDAIENNGNNNQIIIDLHNNFPGLSFWVDAGNNSDNSLSSLKRINFIIATETGITCRQLSVHNGINPGSILSLDFTSLTLKGDGQILDTIEIWPHNVIVMSLHRVGTEQGPDMDLLRYVKSIAPKKNLFAAGGIRNQQYLEHIRSIGLSGALIASALHNKTINTANIEQLSGV